MEVVVVAVQDPVRLTLHASVADHPFIPISVRAVHLHEAVQDLSTIKNNITSCIHVGKHNHSSR
jgi:hypothetical protein